MSAASSSLPDDPPSIETLADRLEHVDGPTDTRHCSCGGVLTLTESGNPICQQCRCTPAGVYLPPPQKEWLIDAKEYLYDARGQWSSASDPKGKRVQTTRPERYDNSNLVVLVGGREELYNADDDIRPNGVTDEYTFDLSTL